MGELVNLDEYRAKRIAEGNWPPNELMVREYWAQRRGLYTKTNKDAPYHDPLSEFGRRWLNKIRGKKEADPKELREALWGPTDNDIA